MMQNFTYGKVFNPGKIAQVNCSDNLSGNNIDIKGKSFLLIIVTEGFVTFKSGEDEFTANAPCFVCFSEKENPEIIRKRKLKCSCIYFHPKYLNVNMDFILIRSNDYKDIAHNHDLFLLRPFINNMHVVPILENYMDKLDYCYNNMNQELENQSDWYWSCRSRSYFIEIIIILERLCQMLENSSHVASSQPIQNLKNDVLKRAIVYIEGNYSDSISLKDIIKTINTNHTTLIKYFKEELSTTPMEYIWQHRISIAKKHLAFTEIPVKDISLRCGFRTVQHFSRIFKEQTDKSPLCFRRDALQYRRDEL